jgi:MsbA_rel: ABC transporter, permease/ATP-binding protein
VDRRRERLRRGIRQRSEGHQGLQPWGRHPEDLRREERGTVPRFRRSEHLGQRDHASRGQHGLHPLHSACHRRWIHGALRHGQLRSRRRRQAYPRRPHLPAHPVALLRQPARPGLHAVQHGDDGARRRVPHLPADGWEARGRRRLRHTRQRRARRRRPHHDRSGPRNRPLGLEAWGRRRRHPFPEGRAVAEPEGRGSGEEGARERDHLAGRAPDPAAGRRAFHRRDLRLQPGQARAARHHLVRQARPEGRARRRHRCRQDHGDQPDQPFLRHPGRHDPVWRHLRQGHPQARPAQVARHRAAGREPVHRHRDGQHPLWQARRHRRGVHRRR